MPGRTRRGLRSIDLHQVPPGPERYHASLLVTDPCISDASEAGKRQTTKARRTCSSGRFAIELDPRQFALHDLQHLLGVPTPLPAGGILTQCPSVPANVVTLLGSRLTLKRWGKVAGAGMRAKSRFAVVVNASILPIVQLPKSLVVR